MPEVTVPQEANKTRLDQYLQELCPEQSRSGLRKWIDQGQVLINGATISKAGTRLRTGDLLNWSIPALKEWEGVRAEDLPLKIVYEDEYLLVINKAVGMVVHPGAGNHSGTMVNALLHHCSDLSGIGGVERPGIVHRLDKDTSGLLVVAKQDSVHRDLSAQLQSREMKRSYYALTEFNFKEKSGVIEAPIGRHPVDRQRMAVVANGRYARTHWRVKETFENYTWLELELDTGRTHQIRVHLKHIKHPLLGDSIYGSKRKHPFRLERPMLHAFQLSFRHPQSGERQTFQADIPEDFNKILEILKQKTS